MSVHRFRSIEDMPKPWRDRDDPENLRAVAQMMELYQRWRGPEPRKGPRVRHFRSLQEMNVDRYDPYRREDRRLFEWPYQSEKRL